MIMMISCLYYGVMFGAIISTDHVTMEYIVSTDPCDYGVHSLNRPCDYGVHSLNRPCDYGVHSLKAGSWGKESLKL